MELHGELKQYPEIFRLYITSILSILITIILIILFVYILWSRYSDSLLVEEAIKAIEAQECKFETANITSSLEADIMSSTQNFDLLLRMNKVSSLEELWKKNKIVYLDCE